jgi:hypothetical protein
MKNHQKIIITNKVINNLQNLMIKDIKNRTNNLILSNYIQNNT